MGYFFRRASTLTSTLSRKQEREQGTTVIFCALSRLRVRVGVRAVQPHQSQHG